MTTVDEAAREGSSPAGAEAPESTAETRAYARASVTPPASVALQAVTDGAQAAQRLALSAVALLDRPGSLIDAQPPTFRQARDRHHECAGHFQAALLRWPRYAWGYVHLVFVKPVLNLAEWITESPARFTVALAIGVVIWFWS